MRQLIGLFLMICGAATGIYLGIWWAFIGGIVNVIEAVRSEELIAMDVAVGVAKVMFAGLIGTVSAVVLVFPGLALLSHEPKNNRNKG